MYTFKEQSHARYFDIRFYDLYEMQLYPPIALRTELAAIYRKYKATEFPPFREQLDRNYSDRYREYWESQEPGGAQQQRFWPVLNQPVEPADARLNFDMEVCAAVGLDVSRAELLEIYGVMAKEIIITRRLVKD